MEPHDKIYREDISDVVLLSLSLALEAINIAGCTVDSDEVAHFIGLSKALHEVALGLESRRSD